MGAEGLSEAVVQASPRAAAAGPALGTGMATLYVSAMMLAGLASSLAEPPPPCNISVASWTHSAEVRWLHGATGGQPATLATHYVVKWQAKNGREVTWHPEWVGLGSEKIELDALSPGHEYALRIAAVNTQGRAWSKVAVFRTLSGVPCSAVESWQPLVDESDAIQLCGADLPSEAPHDGCELPGYLLAGVAAGGTLALILAAMIGHDQCAARLIGRHQGARLGSFAGVRRSSVTSPPGRVDGRSLELSSTCAGGHTQNLTVSPRSSWGGERTPNCRPSCDEHDAPTAGRDGTRGGCATGNGGLDERPGCSQPLSHAHSRGGGSGSMPPTSQPPPSAGFATPFGRHAGRSEGALAAKCLSRKYATAPGREMEDVPMCEGGDNSTKT